MKKAVVIVAGGSGSRMKSDLPKQFIELLGKPILMHTIRNFVNYDRQMKLILVLPQSQISFWKDLCIKHKFKENYELAEGGNTRFESVKNGLMKIKNECLVGIHDGVRPLVSHKTLDNCFLVASQKGNAVPVTDCIESIREIITESSQSVDRNKYKMVQTPQVFKYSAIHKAYEQPYLHTFTDDASVYESAGYKIALTNGNRENIKITTPMDLIIAEAIMNSDVLAE